MPPISLFQLNYSRSPWSFDWLTSHDRDFYTFCHNSRTNNWKYWTCFGSDCRPLAQLILIRKFFNWWASNQNKQKCCWKKLKFVFFFCCAHNWNFVTIGNFIFNLTPDQCKSDINLVDKNRHWHTIDVLMLLRWIVQFHRCWRESCTRIDISRTFHWSKKKIPHQVVGKKSFTNRWRLI